MKKNVFFLIVLFSVITSAQNQKLIATKINTIAIDADVYIGFDGFSNNFYIKNNILYKKGTAILLQYQNLELGKITKVDILNPLKIVVFYEEFNTIIVLDNQLNEIQRIDFSLLETPVLASAVGISGQNKIWIFNSLNQQIGLYDLNTNLYQNISTPIQNGLNYYQTDFNYFQWIDKQNQWNSCSIYGRITSNKSLDTTSNLQFLAENKILFYKDNKFFINDPINHKLNEIQIVEKSFKNFYYKDQILAIFTDKGITNYKITIP